ncbi:MAG: formyltransferase family protein [Flavobacteriales bacterium]|nr:hypothetical protein [Flavobacteriales bacterium]MCX7649411.1 formyltransferase family protein [Flavobacteriales bacterium]MDW8433133.1 formyltransferase family protein [Flavobacteriales bacterium]
MKSVFLGCTRFSLQILQHLLKNDLAPHLVITIPQEFSISYSDTKVKNYNYADLSSVCQKEGIPLLFVDSGQGIKLTTHREAIAAVQPDVILVMGWYYVVPRSIRELARQGAWGIHASLLPKYAGGAPLVWAILQGEKETGITLFRLGDGMDDGDIIAQKKIKINHTDTIKEVYHKATKAAQKVLVQTLKNPEKVRFTPQDPSKIEYYPQRKPEDGEIDTSWDGIRMYNFIRAQAPPYPGAFLRTKDGYKIIIEKCRLEKVNKPSSEQK